MKNRLSIVLACSLMVNVGLLFASQHWKGETKKLKQVAVEEYNYAKAETKKKYIIKQESGLKFLRGGDTRELGCNHTYSSHPKSPELGDYYGNHLGSVVTVDTSDFNYNHKAHYTSEDMSVSQQILLLFCLQIIEQGNFFYGDFMHCGHNAAIGYLQHPAGAVTLMVAEDGKERYCVSASIHVHSSVQHNGGMGGKGLLDLPRSDFSFFTPTYMKSKRASRLKIDQEYYRPEN